MIRKPEEAFRDAVAEAHRRSCREIEACRKAEAGHSALKGRSEKFPNICCGWKRSSIARRTRRPERYARELNPDATTGDRDAHIERAPDSSSK